MLFAICIVFVLICLSRLTEANQCKFWSPKNQKTKQEQQQQQADEKEEEAPDPTLTFFSHGQQRVNEKIQVQRAHRTHQNVKNLSNSTD